MKEILKTIKAAIDDPHLSADIIDQMKKRDEVMASKEARVKELELQLEEVRSEFRDFKKDHDKLINKAADDRHKAAIALSDAETIKEDLANNRAAVARAQGEGEAAYKMAQLVFGNKNVMETRYSHNLSVYDPASGYTRDVPVDGGGMTTVSTQTEV